jgi:hypothetical protein
MAAELSFATRSACGRKIGAILQAVEKWGQCIDGVMEEPGKSRPPRNVRVNIINLSVNVRTNVVRRAAGELACGGRSARAGEGKERGERRAGGAGELAKIARRTRIRRKLRAHA